MDINEIKTWAEANKSTALNYKSNIDLNFARIRLADACDIIQVLVKKLTIAEKVIKDVLELKDTTINN